MTPIAGHDTVLVLDFGAQYAQLIARRVRECHVYSEVVPYDVDPEAVRARGARALILSGGPASVYEPAAPALDLRLLDLGIPVLGLCYGQQAMARALGGRVEPTGVREYGRTLLSAEIQSVLFRDLPAEQTVWMSHGDTVTAAPPGAKVTAWTEAAPVAGFEDPARGLYGVQFHPEVAHTPRGLDLLKNFLYDAAGCRPNWTSMSIIEEQQAAVRAQVGDAHVLCALSGGVDSSVAALLVHRAIGDRLTCVFVDTGLLRHGEAEQVEETFRRDFKVNLVHVKAADRFLDRLAGVTDPEVKRKAIGAEFIRVFEEVARDHDDARFLVQGTLYPDVVESGGKQTATIKTHHNVGGLPEQMHLELVEPLRLLFKDEVRRVGEELGLPEDVVLRQPFPGPGLAVRIVGEVTAERLETLRAADRIVLEEVRRAGLDAELWQWFAVLLAVRTVGVMGDGRTYAYPIVVRAVTSEDAMTADFARLPWEVLERISTRVVGEVPGVNRVAYDVTSKPPGTIEWE
ncbi:MAG TPA: glutamine-hydrolyzing GMP synthase [Actinomycetes bacterium]|jgi:GMP synthase (glutamine-hydrolysing)|nr:glutamine-hydrolyzing GMP synthase [Actinomycetes bacterium]